MTVSGLRAALASVLRRDHVRHATGAASCRPQQWHGSPGPYTCTACGWVTCPDCMRAGMDCGVCTHPTDPVLLGVLHEAWEKGEAFRQVDTESQEP